MSVWDDDAADAPEHALRCKRRSMLDGAEQLCSCGADEDDDTAADDVARDREIRAGLRCGATAGGRGYISEDDRARLLDEAHYAVAYERDHAAGRM